MLSNLKIKVGSEAESKEAQELFIELGYKEPPLGYFNGSYVKSIQAWDDMDLTWSDDHHRVSSEFNEITITKLRDLVVLKRNDVRDATHISEDGTCHYYSSSEGELYFYLNNNGWYATNTRYDNLKPIEKTMKEYLLKTEDGTYHYHNKSHDECPVFVEKIEIPEGADIYAISKNWKENIFFAKSSGDTLETFNTINKNDWHQESTLTLENLENNYSILWQHHTQAEELPFVDDEPSINDQYAEIDQVIQSAYNTQIGGSHYKNLAIQPMEYALKNKLDYAQANVVKYVTRHASKGGKEDLLKAIHNIELMIAHYYS